MERGASVLFFFLPILSFLTFPPSPYTRTAEGRRTGRMPCDFSHGVFGKDVMADTFCYGEVS